MNLPFQFAIQFHELLITLLVAFILFVVGIYLSEKIKGSINKKATMHGSPEVCGACDALIEARRIPAMDKEQKDLRAPGGVLAKLDKTVGELTITTGALKDDIVDLKKDVTKLFTMIEGNWQEQISSLKSKLAEKDQQIRRLEDKG